jgi:hypothetical protein
VRVAKAVCNSFKELKEFKREVFRAKSYFLVKEQGYRRPANNLEYLKGLVLELECKDDLVDRTSSTSLLTNYGSKGCSKDRDRATTP